MADSTTKRQITNRAGKYEREFPPNTLTAADLQQIHTLAALEIQLENLTEEMAELKPEMLNYDKILKSMTDSINKTSQEHRQLLTALRLDRKSRASAEEETLEQRLPQLAKAAYDLLANNAVQIVCPECQGEPAKVDLRQGWIMFHFAFSTPFEWKSECPRCLLKGKHTKVRIDQDNWQKYTPAALDARRERERKATLPKPGDSDYRDENDEAPDSTEAM